ncbi:hypothetical protein TRVL_09066 [Trypanosoma vivax]|nr:hypothetical protein TRVL_09066 [Trypanosoma vivax]
MFSCRCEVQSGSPSGQATSLVSASFFLFAFHLPPKRIPRVAALILRSNLNQVLLALFLHVSSFPSSILILPVSPSAVETEIFNSSSSWPPFPASLLSKAIRPRIVHIPPQNSRVSLLYRFLAFFLIASALASLRFLSAHRLTRQGSVFVSVSCASLIFHCLLLPVAFGVAAQIAAVFNPVASSRHFVQSPYTFFQELCLSSLPVIGLSVSFPSWPFRRFPLCAALLSSLFFRVCQLSLWALRPFTDPPTRCSPRSCFCRCARAPACSQWSYLFPVATALHLRPVR